MCIQSLPVPVLPVMNRPRRSGAGVRAALILLLAASAPLAAQQRYEGTAHAPGSGAVLYREAHWLYRDGGTPARLVLYRCPSGAPFARKIVRERGGAIAPGFDFEDARTGYREGVRERSGRREAYVQESAGAPLRARPLDLPADTVIDAGFDAYVRRHWDALADARGRVVPFLIPSRARAYDMRIAAAGDARDAGRQVRRLRMRLAAWFGFALPDVVLTYDVRERRLLRFEGVGSIRDGRGRNQAVRIEFPDAPAATSQSAVDAAARQPLVARCTG